MAQFVCKHCGRNFKSKHSIAQYCTRECSWRARGPAKRTKKGKMLKRGFAKMKSGGNFEYQQVSRKGFYYQQKDQYINQIVNYAQSPTGKAYIGINKEPLMPNKKGFGYQGVLLQDDSRQFVQCSSCGSWVKKITNAHLNLCSKGKIKTTKAYKAKFGLYVGEGLVSDETSLKYTQSALKNKESIAKYSAKALAKGYKVHSFKKSTKSNIKSRHRRAWENKHGSCPEQIKHRLKEFILNNQELPSQYNRGRPLYKTLIRRFGSFGKGLKYYGLPYFERRGTNYKYTFPDYTVYSYNINKMYDRRQLFEMLKNKCDLFKIQTHD